MGDHMPGDSSHAVLDGCLDLGFDLFQGYHFARPSVLTGRKLDNSKVVRITQGPTTTLQLLQRERFGDAVAWRLLTDNYSMTVIDSQAGRYMQMFAWLPFALHPAPRRALKQINPRRRHRTQVANQAAGMI